MVFTAVGRGKGHLPRGPECEQECEGSEGVSQGTAGKTGKKEPRGAEVMGVMLLTLNQEDTHTYTHTNTRTHIHSHTKAEG